MGLYEEPLSISLLEFGMGTLLANFHLPFAWYYVVVYSRFKYAREECESNWILPSYQDSTTAWMVEIIMEVTQ